MSTQLTSGHFPVTLFNTTDSINISTGSLIVLGGVGIAKNLFIGGNISNTIATTFTITGGTANLTLQPNGNNANINLVTTGTGRTKVSFDPVAANDVANKNYVDASRIFSFSYATGTTNYITISSSATYTAVADFIFIGSAIIGTPTSFLLQACAAATVTNRRLRWRIFDTTNAQVICTSATTNSSTMSIINMGAISNIPTGQAIFQLQQQDTNDAGAPTTHATNGFVAGLLFR